MYQADEWLIHHQFIDQDLGCCRGCGRGLKTEEEYKMKLCNHCYKRGIQIKH
ncbi:hypothetical protein EDD68_11224 [Melghiribacillus thermohalophilus]|uniref:YhfH-like protein n=1 Tax=Melghiribacillus thermohalophilus TaxID=1324956 RepID=A0A4R3MZ61_9BACI|nr:hypothetical protein [Melghiribacillus thermohalophilus]TCT20896.1 hypothetical protein EDD68_11224 [Melghiribacillus thermohalophilus]